MKWLPSTGIASGAPAENLHQAGWLRAMLRLDKDAPSHFSSSVVSQQLLEVRTCTALLVIRSGRQSTTE